MDVDSTAVFTEKLLDYGLNALLPKFLEAGWDTYGLFAHAVQTSGSGNVDDEVFRTRILARLVDLPADGVEPREGPRVRRLFFEAQVLAVNELRQKSERTEDDAPRMIPQPEREARKDKLRARLSPGLKIEGDKDPADCIINRLMQMSDENLLAWLPWECCPTFAQELEAKKARQMRKQWMPDATGAIRERTLKIEPEADLSTHYKVSLALTRRGLAAEIAGVMAFETHEKLVEKLVVHFTETPSDTRYAAPSLLQLQDADKVAWRLLGQACRKGIRPRGGSATLPVDDAMDGVLASAEFVTRLLPVPALPAHGGSLKKRSRSSSHSSARQGRGRGRRGGKKHKKADQDEIKTLKAQLES